LRIGLPVWATRTGIVINVGVADRDRLAGVIVDRNSARKYVWHARIAQPNGDHMPNGKAQTAVWRRWEHLGADVAGLPSGEANP
jgi:hypothetical protein